MHPCLTDGVKVARCYVEVQRGSPGSLPLPGRLTRFQRYPISTVVMCTHELKFWSVIPRIRGLIQTSNGSQPYTMPEANMISTGSQKYLREPSSGKCQLSSVLLTLVERQTRLQSTASARWSPTRVDVKPCSVCIQIARQRTYCLITWPYTGPGHVTSLPSRETRGC